MWRIIVGDARASAAAVHTCEWRIRADRAFQRCRTARFLRPTHPPPHPPFRRRFWSYVYYLSKYYELLDTVLQVSDSVFVVL